MCVVWLFFERGKLQFLLGVVCVLVARVTAGGVGQRELLQTEGTVILHITFALKQDQVGDGEGKGREGEDV